jgi:tRNA/rRNA methyltransferase
MNVFFVFSGMLASVAMPLRNIRIVLVRPRGGANVGAVARAMKNMGLHDLVLVRPAIVRTFWSKTMAVHAEDVLNRARRCDSLAEAVADCGLVVGTTCRNGLYREAAEPPRDVAIRMVTVARSNPVALVFGPEDHGLSNDDLKLCQQLISIPTDSGYASLNLAQAVMVCCYELFLAAQKTVSTAQVLATAERVEFMFQRLQAAFLSIGFLHADNPDHIMFAFRRFLGRAQMEERDVSILLGLARQIEWFGRGGWQTMAAKRGLHPDSFGLAQDTPLPEGEREKISAGEGTGPAREVG